MKARQLSEWNEDVGDVLWWRFPIEEPPCVVCTARLDAAFQLGKRAEGTVVPGASVVRRLVSRQMPECFTVRYDDFGDYAPGRWAWLLRDVRPLIPPPPVRGAQGFFNLPQGWLCVTTG